MKQHSGLQAIFPQEAYKDYVNCAQEAIGWTTWVIQLSASVDLQCTVTIVSREHSIEFSVAVIRASLK